MPDQSQRPRELLLTAPEKASFLFVVQLQDRCQCQTATCLLMQYEFCQIAIGTYAHSAKSQIFRLTKKFILAQFFSPVIRKHSMSRTCIQVKESYSLTAASVFIKYSTTSCSSCKSTGYKSSYFLVIMRCTNYCINVFQKSV